MLNVRFFFPSARFYCANICFVHSSGTNRKLPLTALDAILRPSPPAMTCHDVDESDLLWLGGASGFDGT